MSRIWWGRPYIRRGTQVAKADEWMIVTGPKLVATRQEEPEMRRNPSKLSWPGGTPPTGENSLFAEQSPFDKGGNRGI